MQFGSFYYGTGIFLCYLRLAKPQFYDILGDRGNILESEVEKYSMYKHHEDSLQIMIDYYKKKPEVIALVFGGSVAKGNERVDSDLDGMAIISEEEFARRDAINETTEVVSGLCTYPEGYFDVKFMTKEFLIAAADRGSEPTRNAFVGSRVLFSSDPEIADIVARIPVFQEEERDKKMLSFYCDMMMNYGYFWKACRPEGYMKVRTGSEIVYALYRMILQENRVLFPCNRRLEETVDKIANKPENIVGMCQEFCRTMDDALLDKIVQSFQNWTSYPFDVDINAQCSVYQMDFEKWWLYPRPLIAEW